MIKDKEVLYVKIPDTKNRFIAGKATAKITLAENFFQKEVEFDYVRRVVDEDDEMLVKDEDGSVYQKDTILKSSICNVYIDYEHDEESWSVNFVYSGGGTTVYVDSKETANKFFDKVLKWWLEE